ncbi:MAG: O-acetyl-ADP-ribose deacetylase [Phycisphaerae bacterium]
MPDHSVWSRIEIMRGDITALAIDAIVNAANAALVGGGGVDGAIHRAAGPRLLEACAALGGCETGSAKITPGFEAPAKFVIHAVGPVYRGGGSDEARLLASCYATSMQLAWEWSLRSIAFPAISTGVYGYPFEEATHIALRTVCEALSRPENIVENCKFVFFSEDDFRKAEAIAEELEGN